MGPGGRVTVTAEKDVTLIPTENAGKIHEVVTGHLVEPHTVETSDGVKWPQGVAGTMTNEIVHTTD